MDVKQHWNINVRAQELCECRHNSPYGLCGCKATLEHNVRAQSCVKVVIIVRMISVDVKQHWNINVRAQSCVKVVIIVRTVSMDVKQHRNIASELRAV